MYGWESRVCNMSEIDLQFAQKKISTIFTSVKIYQLSSSTGGWKQVLSVSVRFYVGMWNNKTNKKENNIV